MVGFVKQILVLVMAKAIHLEFSTGRIREWNKHFQNGPYYYHYYTNCIQSMYKK